MSEFSHAIQEFQNYGMPACTLFPCCVVCELEKNLQESCTCSPPQPPSSSIAEIFLQTFSLNCSPALKLIDLHTKFPWKIRPNNFIECGYQTNQGEGFNKHNIRLSNSNRGRLNITALSLFLSFSYPRSGNFSDRIPECWHNPGIIFWAALVNFLQS